jgi:hypothetical protein
MNLQLFSTLTRCVGWLLRRRTSKHVTFGQKHCVCLVQKHQGPLVTCQYTHTLLQVGTGVNKVVRYMNFASSASISFQYRRRKPQVEEKRRRLNNERAAKLNFSRSFPARQSRDSQAPLLDLDLVPCVCLCDCSLIC